MRKILRKSYRWIQRVLVKKFILPHFFSGDRLLDISWRDLESKTDFQKRRVWVHAASVGELESLSHLVLKLAEQGYELVLTVMSESARESVERLGKNLAPGASLIYCGYAPWEGEWSVAFQAFRPHLWITAKYEAWPDLWVSLKEQAIPLAIVSVHARRSLRIAKAFCWSLLGEYPFLILFPCNLSKKPALHSLFPNAFIEVAGEPRWDRVYSRLNQGHFRAQELIHLCQNLKRPWGVIGSAWLEDLEFLSSILKSQKGTVWIVPHQVHLEEIDKIRANLKGLDLDFSQTSQMKKNIQILEDQNCLLVDEMGFLAELYSVADWAYVGGGWGAGVHSTIEPAIYGIPLGVGPRGIEKFYEIEELTESGQLQVLHSEEKLSEWWSFVLSCSEDQKKSWKEQAQSRLGATGKILSTLEKFCF